MLHAIVADYIASQDPVGSKALLERHKLNVSSATIRNDMAVLEAEGYIQQQHASSGRVPTEKGYRQFVDALQESVKPLTRAERRAILSFLENGVDLEDVLRRSVRLLSKLTHQAAIVQMPALSVSRVRHCEVVALAPTRLLLVLITDNGRVDQRNVELAAPLADEDAASLRDLLNRVLQSKTLRAAKEALEHLQEHAPDGLQDPVQRCARVLIDTLVEQPNDRLILAGTSHLTRMRRELPAVLDALEEQVVMLRLFTNVTNLGGVNVVIGEETQTEELHGAAVVTSSYGTEGSPLGGVGVVGPTYMDYTGTIAKVAAVATYISRVLSGE